jgi:hypothetical protein
MGLPAAILWNWAPTITFHMITLLIQVVQSGPIAHRHHN